MATPVPSTDNLSFAGGVGKAGSLKCATKIARVLSVKKSNFDMDYNHDRVSIMQIELRDEQRCAVVMGTLPAAFAANVFDHLLMVRCSDDVKFKLAVTDHYTAPACSCL